MGSVCSPEVTDSGTCSLGTTYLKCESVRIAGFSGAGLKKFYYTNILEEPDVSIFHSSTQKIW
jgi:hypothetical protein